MNQSWTGSISTAHWQALKTIISRLVDLPYAWAVTGSLGMALQGMTLPVHDIDLQTGQAGAYAIGRRLASFTITPVRLLESERIRSHLGLFEMDGVQVEVMGDLQNRLENQGWGEPVQVEDHRQWVELAGLRVPVLSLEYEVQAYHLMGRKEKAQKVQAWLDDQKGTPTSPQER